MKKMPEVTDATRQTFVEAFCDLYIDNPIEKISVKDVILKAGYSRATFYNYFKDEYDLRDHAENVFIDSIMERVLENIRTGRPIEKFVQIFIEILNDENFYINVFIGSANNSQFIEKINDKVAPILIDAFNVRDDNLKAPYAIKFYISGLISTIRMWLKDEYSITKGDFASLIKGILWDGIIRQLDMTY